MSSHDMGITPRPPGTGPVTDVPDRPSDTIQPNLPGLPGKDQGAEDQPKDSDVLPDLPGAEPEAA